MFGRPLPVDRKWSGDPSGGPELVGTISCRSETGLETHVGLELFGTSSWRSELFERPSRRSGTGWDFHQDGRKWSADPPGGLEVVGRTSRRS